MYFVSVLRRVLLILECFMATWPHAVWRLAAIPVPDVSAASARCVAPPALSGDSGQDLPLADLRDTVDPHSSYQR